MALNFKIIYSTLADDSLDDIRNYILYRSGNLKTANRVFNRIVVFIDTLSYNPFIGRVVDIDEYETKEKDIRRITTLDKRYNIYYRADEQARTVYILKIADGRQSIDRQLSGL